PVPAVPPPGLPITPRRWTAMDAAQRVALTVAAQLFTGGGPPPDALHGPGLIAIGSSLSLGRERALNSAAELDLAARAIPALDALAHLDGEDRRGLAARTRRRFGAPEDPGAPGALDGWLASGTAAVIAGEFRLAAVPVAVEAACASSLAALDLAVGALRSGTARYAIAGGVELACNVRDLILCSSLGLLSHSKITPFDEAADGFSPGDGCALFLLKRHSDALEDGDRILGVIRGVGGSNDAHSLIAPDRGGQARAMRQAFGDAGFGPDTVDYLEAHGTGTRVGDRVELSAVTDVYGGGERRRPLQVGSAKSFFGHTFAAAGAAGLLRVLLALQARTFPPNANLRTISPELDLDAIPAFIDRRPAPWPAGGTRPRRAALSSFGTGGINYHVLIEEHPDGVS
ncbi:polyketide synthase, partial [Catenulispora pinisilvae]